MLPFITVGATQIPTYFMLISLAACLGIFYLLKEAESQKLSSQIALDLSLAFLIGAFVGSRLFHVFYEEPSYYFKEPLAVFWVWQGGFVFYGGLMGATILGVFLLRWRKQNIWDWLDVAAVSFLPVYAIGRFATLLSGSGYGKPTNLPWAIVYPAGSEAPHGIALHPTPIYSILWVVSLWALLLVLKKRRHRSKALKQPGQLFFISCAGYATGRFIIEQFRDDPRGYNLLAFSVSSWLSFLILIASVIFFVKGSKDAHRESPPS